VPALEALKKPFERWPAEPLERLAVEQSLPDWAARLLHEQYGEDSQALAAALNRRAPLTLRTNTLKLTRDELVAKLAAEGVPARPGTLSPVALVAEGRPNVFALAAFKDGLFEVQDEGSQLIALACGARPGQHVVDACAGAGGKTLALAAQMRGKGRILACDVTDERLEDLKPRAKRAGAFTITARAVPEGAPGDAALAGELGRADVVLVDAPCTGTGSWRRNPDARWRMTGADAASFPARQQGILRRSATLVRPGGRLVYATCSLLRAENEDVAAWFAQERPDFEAARLDLPAEALDAQGRLRLLPHVHGTDGFFAAAFVRRG
jgi:16S rRNA (cytosine967-C5)-methyltransferase